MNNAEKFARKELDILSRISQDPDNRPIIEEFKKEIISLVKKFGNSGQSGGSAPYTAAAISQTVKKLCLFQPITPITGEDDEWTVLDYDDNLCYQNKRCGALFKNKNDRSYYLDAIVWRGQYEWDKGTDKWNDTFTGTLEGISSRQYIKGFPFVPKTFYIDVYRTPYDENIHNKSETVSCGSGDFVYFIKNKEQLKEVFEYYDEFRNNLKDE